MNTNFIIPVANEIKGQSELILKNVGLSFIKPKFYNIDTDGIANENADSESDGNIGNLLGMPVFDSIIFKNPTGNATQTFADNQNSNLVNDNDLILTTALITANKNKNIVVTKVQGRNGSIKEYVSDDDYQINIRGVIVGKYANKRPIDELKKLEDFCNSPLEIDVVCPFINDLGVLTVVITGHSKTQREGTRNVFDFEINCLQETPFEIKSNA